MSTNPYAPPNAVVADMPVADVTVEPPFFAVSAFKLVVMSVFTLGLYQMYWFFRNWGYIKERDRSRILPAMRSIFSLIFCYPCFARMRRDTATTGSPNFPAGLLATLWIMFQIASQLEATWFMSLLSVLLLIPIQNVVNLHNAVVAPDHDRNESIKGWNWVWIACGGLLLMAAVIGTLMPELVNT
jgi:hypothetical protein